MDLVNISQLRVELKNLEAKDLSTFSLMERCEIEQEILDIKSQLGLFRSNIEQGGECINCSG